MLKLELTKDMLLFQVCFRCDHYANFENYFMCRIPFEELLGVSSE